MTDQIITRTTIRAFGRSAFAAGRGRDDHNMNPGSAAIVEWQQGWDDAKAERAQPVSANA